MSIVATAGKQRGKEAVWWDTNKGVRTGRWRYAPFLPDRCHNCFAPDLSSYPAEGYIATRQTPFPVEILNQTKDELRQGICHRCHPELADPDYVGGVVETRFYFSGVAGNEERAMLQEAQVSHIIVDVFDYPLVKEWWDVCRAFDCGAYRVWKSSGRLKLDPDEYLETAEAEQDNLDFVIAADVIGDAEATRTLWLQTMEWLTVNMGDVPSRYWPRIVPVWHWGSSIELLEQYLEESFLVAIGGLVPWLRERYVFNPIYQPRLLCRLTDLLQWLGGWVAGKKKPVTALLSSKRRMHSKTPFGLARNPRAQLELCC